MPLIKSYSTTRDRTLPPPVQRLGFRSHLSPAPAVAALRCATCHLRGRRRLSSSACCTLCMPPGWPHPRFCAYRTLSKHVPLFTKICCILVHSLLQGTQIALLIAQEATSLPRTTAPQTKDPLSHLSHLAKQNSASTPGPDPTQDLPGKNFRVPNLQPSNPPPLQLSCRPS